jgi:hypothetical protein
MAVFASFPPLSASPSACPPPFRPFTPLTVALCIIALTDDVYRKAYDENGNLQHWGPGNKVAAVLILLIQCFIIYLVIMMS